MKKIVLLLAAVVLLGGVMGGCNSSKKLVMATEATFRPYEYMEGSKVVGVDVEIAKELAKELGRELVIDNMNFDGVIPAVQSGRADFGAAGISIREDRLEQVDFSIEYAISDQVILTTAGSGITGEADLDGKVVGVQMSTTADLVLSDEYPNVTIDRYKRYTDAALELVNGRIDAIVLDSLPAEYYRSANEGFIICDGVLFTDRYAIAVKKGNTEMLDAINKVLQRLIDEGKIDAYTQEHLSK